ncbi:MAG: glycosyltransferase family 4 protein [Verrucomicrobia subdivision 3 bacterium]|nr:glycosyltransferase family 4 protein [Limisphaerales bacterium]
MSIPNLRTGNVKILVLTHLYPPHHAGTYDMRCQMQTDALRLRGHNIRVLTSKHGMNQEQRGGDVDRRLILNAVFGHDNLSRFRELRALEVENHRILGETIAEFQPDLIHVYSLMGLPKSFVFALRQSRLPTVYDVADPWIADGVRTDPWLRWWNRPRAPIISGIARVVLEAAAQRNKFDHTAPTRMMKGYDRIPELYGDNTHVQPDSISAFRFDRLYFCSQALKQATEQAGFKVSHGEVIYPGIPTQSYVGDVRPASAPATRLLTVATLGARSGVLTAVKALQLLREDKVNVSLSIYGRGDTNYVAEIRSFVAQHQLPVEFLPVSNIHRDLPQTYRKHDVLLHTAEWNEPYSLTPLEAMACGLPVIGAAAGGVGELLRHGENALVYMPGDEAELAKRIQQLQAQPALRCQIAETGQQEVLSKYNETAVVDQIENYLQTSLEVWGHTAS